MMQWPRFALQRARMRLSLQLVQPARLLVTPERTSSITLQELRAIERAMTGTSQWWEVRRAARQLRRGLGVSHPTNASKYLDVDLWLRANVLRAARLGLHRTTGLSVLDVGCGAGLFMHVCRTLGHDVTGLDLPTADLPYVDAAVYGAMTSLLGLDVIRARITCSGQLPLPRRYDVMTAFMVCFNGHNSPAEWGVEQWRMFTCSIAAHLEPGGRLHLGFNARGAARGDSRFYDANTAAWWQECRAATLAQSVTLVREAMLEARRDGMTSVPPDQSSASSGPSTSFSSRSSPRCSSSRAVASCNSRVS